MLSAIDKLGWIKELVRAEHQMEEKGVIDFDIGFDPAKILLQQSISFMKEIKEAFVEATSAFNQLKGSAVGRVKIYGISNTEADFMLFRNGLKLIFCLKEPGIVGIRYQYVGTPYGNSGNGTDSGSGAVVSREEDQLLAQWGAFGDLSWTYKGHPMKVDHMIRYYLTRFLRESAK